MRPTELHLFNDAEQSLLVATEQKRLDEMSEDELDELFTRVRRARTKYTKLYRRQSSSLVAEHSSRSGSPVKHHGRPRVRAPRPAATNADRRPSHEHDFGLGRRPNT